MPGAVFNSVVIPGTSRTALYVLDVRDPSMRKFVFQVNVPECTVNVCGLCIFAESTGNEYGPKACFDLSQITQDVNIIVPDNPTIVLGGCGHDSVITLGTEDCNDANTVNDAISLAQARNVDVTIKIYPGTYPMSSVEIADLNISFEGVMDDCSSVVITPVFPLVENYLFSFVDAIMQMSNLTIDLRGNPANGVFYRALVQTITKAGVDCKFSNVCFLSDDNFGGVDTSVVFTADPTNINIERCSWDQGSSNVGTRPNHALSVQSPVTGNIYRCVFGNNQLPTQYSSAVDLLANTNQFQDPDSPSIINVNECTVTSSSATGMVLGSSNNGIIRATSCSVFKSNVGIEARRFSPNIPGSVTIEKCNFEDIDTRNIVVSTNSPTADRIKVSILDCVTRGIVDELDEFLSFTTSKTTSIKYTTWDSEPENYNIGASIVNVGSPDFTNITGVSARVVSPEYVFLFDDSEGTYSANIAVQIIGDVPFAIERDQDDILWVGTSIVYPLGGVSYYIEDRENPTSAVVTQGTTFPTKNISKFTYNLAGGYYIDFTRPFAQVTSTVDFTDTRPNVIASPYITKTNSFGTVNGQDGHWIGIKRTSNNVPVFPPAIRRLRLVELGATVFVSGQEPLRIAQKVQLKYKNLNLKGVDLGGGIPSEVELFVGTMQKISSYEFEGDGVAVGPQGVSASENFRSRVDVSQPMNVRVTYAAANGNLSTSTRLQAEVICRSVESGSETLVSIGALGAENVNRYDSGYTQIPLAVADQQIGSIEFSIPAGTFMEAIPIANRYVGLNIASDPAYTFFVSVSRDVTGSDSETSSLYLLKVELGFVEYY